MTFVANKRLLKFPFIIDEKVINHLGYGVFLSRNELQLRRFGHSRFMMCIKRRGDAGARNKGSDLGLTPD